MLFCREAEEVVVETSDVSSCDSVAKHTTRRRGESTPVFSFSNVHCCNEECSPAKNFLAQHCRLLLLSLTTRASGNVLFFLTTIDLKLDLHRSRCCNEVLGKHVVAPCTLLPPPFRISIPTI
jgi:hypothetical protein